MKKILFFYADHEINTDSTMSIPRLIAASIHQLEKEFDITFFTFDSTYSDTSISLKPVLIKISPANYLQQKISNRFLRKKISNLALRKKCIAQYIKQHKTSFDIIVAPGLDDVHLLKLRFPSAKIIYWIHGISAIYNSNYLRHINDADVIWSPTVTIYKKIIEALHPKVYTGQFQWLPNWAHQAFGVFDENLVDKLRIDHAISATVKVFIFCGGEKKLKGWYLLENAFKLMKSDVEIILLFAGGAQKADEKINEKIRIIYTGMLTPQRLSAYYRLAEFGLFPSLGGYEHAPLTLIEMIKCNVIPIASNVGGIEEMLGTNYHFLINEPHAIQEWVNAIEETILFSEVKKEMLLSFLKENMKRYAWVNTKTLIEKIL